MRSLGVAEACRGAAAAREEVSWCVLGRRDGLGGVLVRLEREEGAAPEECERQGRAGELCRSGAVEGCGCLEVQLDGRCVWRRAGGWGCLDCRVVRWNLEGGPGGVEVAERAAQRRDEGAVRRPAAGSCGLWLRFIGYARVCVYQKMCNECSRRGG